MSEYYLADRRQEQRASREASEQPQALEVKLSLLGELVFAQTEPQGADPYNSRPMDSVRDAWSGLRARR